MRNLLWKEFKLAASPLTYLFLPMGFMFFLPGYPVLCGAFFITLGIFRSFLSTRETNDILYSALLPIRKRDAVKGKYLFAIVIEIAGLIPMCIAVMVRATVLRDVTAYRNNALMNANLYALALALVIFAFFNAVFLSGFFKTAYKTGRPFFLYIITAFAVICIGEATHYFPGLEWLNAFGFDYLPRHLLILLSALILYIVTSYASYSVSCRRFEQIDL